MNLPWVAGAIRGRALARRRLGDQGVHDLSHTRSLARALSFLAASSYGHRVRADLDVPRAQRAVADTTLWHLRVLAGWLPPSGVELVRQVAAWFELANVEGRVAVLATGGQWRDAPYALGALATVWPRMRDAATLADVRALLAHSPWGDPGGDTTADLLLGLRLGWARRLRSLLPQAQRWGDGALAVALAKGRYVHDPTHAQPQPRVPELGSRWMSAATLPAFVSALPPSARWVFANVHAPQDLWDAERTWWERVDREATSLLEHERLGRTVVTAAATVLVTDCWRTMAALEQAARGHPPDSATAANDTIEETADAIA